MQNTKYSSETTPVPGQPEVGNVGWIKSNFLSRNHSSPEQWCLGKAMWSPLCALRRAHLFLIRKEQLSAACGRLVYFLCMPLPSALCRPREHFWENRWNHSVSVHHGKAWGCSSGKTKLSFPKGREKSTQRDFTLCARLQHKLRLKSTHPFSGLETNGSKREDSKIKFRKAAQAKVAAVSNAAHALMIHYHNYSCLWDFLNPFAHWQQQKVVSDVGCHFLKQQVSLLNWLQQMDEGSLRTRRKALWLTKPNQGKVYLLNQVWGY